MIEITKDIFEKVLPVGMSSHEELFDSLSEEIKSTVSILYEKMLGDEGAALVESDTNSLLWHFEQYSVISAFLKLFRQLDLVLTPSGFGIVSNTNVSPASKQRVDALEGQLRTRQLYSRAMILDRLRSESWGTTHQAITNIPRLCCEYWFFYVMNFNTEATYQDWNTALADIKNADEALRKRISDEMMDEMLEVYRTGNREVDKKIYLAINEIWDFTQLWLGAGNKAAFGIPYRKLMRILDNEDNAETFATYLNSDAYKANHVEIFQNTKDSTGYLFNG
ncbi:MAG: hypothetical protein LUC88_00255 [Prevotella sp.]|nr:hypothetical protein [Prevotella sp.]